MGFDSACGIELQASQHVTLVCLWYPLLLY